MKYRLIAGFGAVAFWLSWPYSYMHLRQHRRVRILAVANDAVLLIRPWHDRTIWVLPGGGIEYRETPQSAARRELVEETGIVCDTAALTPMKRLTYYERKLRFDCEYFHLALNTQPVAKAHLPEVLECRWVPIAELDSYRLGQDVRHALDASAALV